MRAFIAAPLPEEIRERLRRLQQRLQGGVAGQVAWQRLETSHLTLRFLGDVPEDSLDKIASIMLSVSDSHPAFTVAVRGVGAFPSASRSRIVWAGLTEIEPLLTLYADLDAGLRTVGILPEERPFRPHLTLGRLRVGSDLRTTLHDVRSFDGGPLPIERIILYQSRLLPQGAQHTPRVVAPLAPPTSLQSQGVAL